MGRVDEITNHMQSVTDLKTLFICFGSANFQ